MAPGENLAFARLDVSVLDEGAELGGVVDLNTDGATGEAAEIEIDRSGGQQCQRVAQLPFGGSVEEVAQLRIGRLPIEPLGVRVSFRSIPSAEDDIRVECQPVDRMPATGASRCVWKVWAMRRTHAALVEVVHFRIVVKVGGVVVRGPIPEDGVGFDDVTHPVESEEVALDIVHDSLELRVELDATTSVDPELVGVLGLVVSASKYPIPAIPNGVTLNPSNFIG